MATCRIEHLKKKQITIFNKSLLLSSTAKQPVTVSCVDSFGFAQITKVEV